LPLGEPVREVRRHEDQARRRVAYEAVRAERDALAAELAEVYRAVAEKLADIVSRIAANDARIAVVNRKSRPDGVASLVSAAVARGVPSTYLVNVSQLTRDGSRTFGCGLSVACPGAATSEHALLGARGHAAHERLKLPADA
jgi:hypothetical protein